MTGSTEGKLVRVRLPFEKGFTQLPNEWLRDELLSWKARGLLAYLMSHDEGFTVTIRALATAGTDGRAAVQAAVTELTDRGYLTRAQMRTRHGALTHVQWTIHDPFQSGYPHTDRSTPSEKAWSEPLAGFPPPDNQPAGNQPGYPQVADYPSAGNRPTEEEQLKEHLTQELKSPTIDAHADREEPPAVPKVETPADRYQRLIHERCHASRSGRSHAWLSSGYCDRCGVRQPEALQLVDA